MATDFLTRYPFGYRLAGVLALLAGGAVGGVAPVAHAQMSPDCDGDETADIDQTLIRIFSSGLIDDFSGYVFAGSGAPANANTGPGTDVLVFDSGVNEGAPFNLAMGSSFVREAIRVERGALLLSLNESQLAVTGNLPGCRELSVGSLIPGDVPALFEVDSGSLFVERLVIGNAPGSEGSVDLSFVGHIQSVGGALIVGDQGPGFMLSQFSSTVLGDSTTIGRDAPGRAEFAGEHFVSINSASSFFPDLVIGERSRGELVLTGSSVFLASADVTPGRGDSGTTAERQLTPVRLDMVLGAEASGVGILRAINGGFFEAGLAGALIVGDAGSGLIEVGAGSQFTFFSETSPVLAARNGSRGRVQIDGNGSWIGSLDFPTIVGPNGSAQFVVNGQGDSEGRLIIAEGGVLAGNGTHEGDVDVNGVIAPGELTLTNQSPLVGDQTLDVLGSVNFNPPRPGRGELRVTLRGGDAGVSDALFVSGDVSLAGTLTIEFDPRSPLRGNERFTIVRDLDEPSISGQFDQIVGGVLPDGTYFVPQYFPDRVELVPLRPEVPLDDTQLLGSINTVIGEQSPIDSAVADLNGDGFPELVALINRGETQQGRLLIFRNLGIDANGSWQGYEEPQAVLTGAPDAIGVTLPDFDGDGSRDIAVLHRGDLTRAVSVFYGDGSGDFQGAAPDAFFDSRGMPKDITSGDLDADGADEISFIFEIPPSQLRGEQAKVFGAFGFIKSISDKGGFIEEEEEETGDNPDSIDHTMNEEFPAERFAMAKGEARRAATPGTGLVVTSLDENRLYYHPTANDRFLGAPTTVLVGTEPGDIGLGDVNGDGLTDILIANTGSGSVSLIVAQPGDPDPMEPVYDRSIQIPLPGDLTGVTPVTPIFSDVNDDGFVDILVVSNSPMQGRSVFVARRVPPEPSVSAPLVFSPFEPFDLPMSVGIPNALLGSDVDLDGRSDIVIVTEPAGGGTMGAVESEAVVLRATAQPCSIADVDADGDIDILDLILFLQNFDPPANCPGDAACFVADLDGNNRIDVFDLLLFLRNYDEQDPNCLGN